MLNWLAKSTRPDIAFAVSQVARFQVNPRRSHENAVLRICKYLRDTKEEGMTMRAKNEGFVVYADSDFAGGYMKGHTHDPDTAKSRSAYYIMFNGCLVFWSSKLQTEIALSTTEAEYICLSQTLRTTKYLMRFLREVSKNLPEFQPKKPIFRCTVFEDNNGAIELAKSPKLKPRTKHIHIKYHHFKSEVGKSIHIEKIGTEKQLADIGTKPLSRNLFARLRKELIGW